MRRLILLAIVWALACLVMFAPVRWALGFLPASATQQIVPGSVSGTFFRGQVSIMLPQTSWPVSISYSNKLRDAFFGRPFSKLVFNGNGLSGRAHMGLKSGKDIQAELAISQLPISDQRLAGVAGDVFLSLDRFKIDISNSGEGKLISCEEAQGQVRTNILTANQSRWQWRGPILSGPISCEDDALRATLKGRDDVVDVNVDLRLHAEGRYEVEMQMRPLQEAPSAFGFVLGVLGFEEQSDGSSRLYEQGQIFQGSRR